MLPGVELTAVTRGDTAGAGKEEGGGPLAECDGACGGWSCMAGGVTGIEVFAWGSAVLMRASSRACVSPKLRVSDRLRSAAVGSRSERVVSPGCQWSRVCCKVVRMDAVNWLPV